MRTSRDRRSGPGEDKLVEGVGLVPSGVVQLAKLQDEWGFAYVKIE